MIHVRTISESDRLGVLALWEVLHRQGPEDNCWPEPPQERRWRHWLETCLGAVAEEDPPSSLRDPPSPAGFAFWTLDRDGNAQVHALGAREEKPYLHLMLPILRGAKEFGYGWLRRSRPEYAWYVRLGATFQPHAHQPLTPEQEAKIEAEFAGRNPDFGIRGSQENRRLLCGQARRSARVPLADLVIVPVRLISAIEARLAALEENV